MLTRRYFWNRRSTPQYANKKINADIHLENVSLFELYSYAVGRLFRAYYYHLWRQLNCPTRPGCGVVRASAAGRARPAVPRPVPPTRRAARRPRVGY